MDEERKRIGSKKRRTRILRKNCTKTTNGRHRWDQGDHENLFRTF